MGASYSSPPEGDIYYVPRFTVNEGKLDNLKSLEIEMTRDTKKFDGGCLAYEWHLSEDGKTVHVVQVYKNSAALLHHIKGTFSRYKEVLVECITFKGLEIYGSASDETKVEAASAFAQIWDDGDCVYFTRFGGFSRAGRDKSNRERVL
jgi:quinol monooxygenase YgiN